ncbi:MAG: HTH domain-containing protein [Schwartzia sp.]|nr:HTH domain-containing protein [Schwartzia sp. (in: firmicutes)]
MEHRVIEILQEEPDIYHEALGKMLGITRCIIQKDMSGLQETGRIECVGGNDTGTGKFIEFYAIA